MPAAHGPTSSPCRVGSAARPVVALVAGVLMLLLAGGAGIGGAVLIGLSDNRDANGFVTSPTLQVSSSTAAITVEDVSLHAGDLWARNLGNVGGVRVTATSATGIPLFLGIAPQAAVDGWLDGIAHDRLVNLNNSGNRYQHADGVVRGVSVSAGQTFWLATATGADPAVLTWQATNGDFAVVLANADGTPAVSGAVTVATQVPNLTPLGVGLLGGAAGLVLVGFWIVYLGATRIGRRHHRPTPPGSPPAAPAAPAQELARAI